MADPSETRLAERKYVALDVLNRISSLEMRARELVEGTMSGLQRSPYLGVSSEFAQHRPYVPGDDVRHVDWKVWARTQRYYLRQFQEETNFVVTLLLDCSESMRFGVTGRTKLDHGCLLAASLAHLVLRQSDAVSLGLFDESLLHYLPPRTGLGTLGLVASQMETIEPERGTKLTQVMPVVSEMVRRRGIVVVISDFLDVVDAEKDPRGEQLGHALGRLRHRGHEIVVFHVMDPQEMVFEFDGRRRFEGMEGLAAAVADPSRIRADYLDIVHEFLSLTKATCVNARADYALANTAEPVDRLLIRYLTARGKVREGRR